MQNSNLQLKIKQWITPVVIIVLSVFSLLFTVHSIYAQGDNSLEVIPSFTDVTLPHASSEAKIKITYFNHSQKAVGLDIFALDFKQQNDNGFITFIGQDVHNFSYSLASFLSLESNQIELGPNEKKDFMVTVTNREDLSPGGHYAAIIAKMANDLHRPAFAQVAPSLSTFILLRKTGGERFSLSLKSSNWPDSWLAITIPNHINLEFQNDGNIHVVPYGRVEIHDLLGRLVYKGIINPSSLRILPETRRLLSVELKKSTFNWPIMFEVLKVNGYDSLKKTSFTYQKPFLYINLWLVGFVVVLILLFMWKRQKK